MDALIQSVILVYSAVSVSQNIPVQFHLQRLDFTGYCRNIIEWIAAADALVKEKYQQWYNENNADAVVYMLFHQLFSLSNCIGLRLLPLIPGREETRPNSLNRR